MNDTAEVYLWGTGIGIIHQDVSKAYASFEYDENFVDSGIELSPLRMPLSKKVYEFPGLAGEPFYGMPGLAADSFPRGSDTPQLCCAASLMPRQLAAGYLTKFVDFCSPDYLHVHKEGKDTKSCAGFGKQAGTVY